jgi:hypothetical protein
MATSGSWDYGLTAANIIDMAVENLGVLASGGTIVAADQTLALRRLNTIAKQYQGTADGAQGLKIHTRQRITLMLAKDQQTYLIGPATGDARSSTAVYRTTIDGAEAIGQTVLSVTDTSDTTTYPGTTGTMTASDIIGIQQNDGTIFWTTVSSISAGVSVTVGAGLDVAAAVGNYVWWFTSRAQRFPVIESAVLREAGYTTTPLDVYTEVREYEYGVSDKYADGTPTAILVEPLRIATRITLNSQPTDVQQQIILTVLYPAEDYDATTNDIAFPQEAFRFLSWELSFEIAPAFQANWTPQMEKLRLESRQAWMNLNPENSVLYFQPNQ